MEREEMDMQCIVGKTPIRIEVIEGQTILQMAFSDGSYAEWRHDQDCCEYVRIQDVSGDFSDLIGFELLVADERTNNTDRMDIASDDEFLWTFYTFRSQGGTVDVRWLGESNGYYSEDVGFYYTPNASEAEA